MEGRVRNAQHANDEQEYSLNEWHFRARISKENTSNSRRYSASYIRSFREDSSRSFRSNFTISSTASSPGYHLKDEIDPSTYSFTTALKALQARSGYVWECLSPEGFALNSKWNEAERYIRNPLSGEIPMECLSAKTLSGRSFRSYMASRVTMSAPLVYSLQPRFPSSNSKPPSNNQQQHFVKPQVSIQEKQIEGNKKDVGIQSSQRTLEGSSSSPSDISTPSIRERPINNRCQDIEDQDDDVQNSSSSLKSKTLEECMMQVEVKVTREEVETKRSKKDAQMKKRHKTRQLCVCNQISGCFLISSWKNLFIKRCHNKDKSIIP